MKILLIAIASILIIGFTSCVEMQTSYEKPFIIISKSEYVKLDSTSTYYCRFTYNDKNGKRFSFFEEVDSYQIGDTIK